MENQGNEKFVISSIIHDIFKNIDMIISISISVAFLVFIAAKLNYTPTFTSSATFVVSSKTGGDNAYVNLTKTKEMIEPFSMVMDSQILRKKVAEELKMDTFPGTVKVEAVPETNLITMSVSSDKPENSLRLLKALLDVYPEVGEKVLGEVSLNMFEQPHYPAEPDNRFKGVNILAEVFALTFVLITALMSVLSYIKDTVKSENEVDIKLDTNLFGVLYHEKSYKNLKSFLKKDKKRILLTDPNVSFMYDETVKKICTKLLYKISRQKSKILLISSTEDGEGKSTVSMNMAQAMANRDKNVLLIEGDLRNCGLSKCLKIEEENINSWGECLRFTGNIENIIFRPKQTAFDIMINDKPVSDAAEFLALNETVDTIKRLTEKYDVIVVDGPPSKQRADAAVWAQIADASLLIVKENMVETKYVNDTIDMLKEYNGNLLGCILNNALKVSEISSTGYGYGSYGDYGNYGSYGRYGAYGKYGKYHKSGSEDVK